MQDEMKYLSSLKVYIIFFPLLITRQNFNIFLLCEKNYIEKGKQLFIKNGMRVGGVVSNIIKVVIFINCPFRL